MRPLRRILVLSKEMKFWLARNCGPMMLRGVEYLAQVRWRLHFDFAGLSEPVPGPIYFRDELRKPMGDESVCRLRRL